MHIVSCSHELFSCFTGYLTTYVQEYFVTAVLVPISALQLIRQPQHTDIKEIGRGK